MRYKNIELGITKDMLNRVKFSGFNKEICFLSDCILYSFLCFYITILKGNCRDS